ncbi:T9SS type A sorting domain-containing protein [Gracilimonas sp.]|uniref:T9SS type A sorting domain-containing protein n=1 Tax=Gracilimonas sp. TaxID=1974203 RepID=UPI0032EC14C4
MLTFVLMAMSNLAIAQTAPAAPDGFVANGSGAGSGQVFLAVGPNNVEADTIEYRLFYSETASAPADPTTATEYTFGSTAGDGGGNAAFGFLLSGLNPGVEYTFWLYQYDTANEVYSDPVSATQAAGGGGATGTPNAPAGFVANDSGAGSGQVFLAVGPNDVASENVEYRLFYSATASAPADPTTATEYTFGSTDGDGGGNAAFGFLLSGLDPGVEYTFWLYQYNSAEELFSEPTSATQVAGGGTTQEGELLTNGDFESGRAPWTDTAGEIRTEGGNSYFFADVQSAGQPFDVNLSQVVEIIQGGTYTLSFDASTATGQTRTMIAGIGLNEGPFTSATETVELTGETQTFTYVLSSAGFGSANSRVLFDMGAATGIVVIDNVSLMPGGEIPPVEVAAPETAAPAPPARSPEDVISLFSDSYTNVDVTTWSTEWSEGTTNTDIEIADGDTIKRFDLVNFSGIQLANSIDLTEFTHMHFDYWVADDLNAGEVFSPKLSNHGNLPETAGETSAIEFTNPVTTSKQWVSFDVALDEFSIAGGASAARDKIYQIIMGAAGTLDNVYIDNFYFYKTSPATIESFSLVAPADGASLSLTGEASTEVEISWSEAESNQDVSYTWHADAPEGDFSDPLLSIPADNNGAGTTLTLTYQALDDALAGLGVEEGGSIDIIWTVTATAGDSTRFAEMPYDLSLTRGMLTSNEVETSPDEFALDQNYPNPFNPTTNISYQIPSVAAVTLTVYDITGREIARFSEGRKAPGSYSVTFDASNLSSGMYIYRIEAGNFTATKKMMLIK